MEKVEKKASIVVPAFKSFKVTVPDNVRYWEDEMTGLIVRKGRLVEVNPKHFRGMELKFAIMRSFVRIAEGEAIFLFKGNLIKAVPGENKNLIEVLEGPEAGKMINAENAIPLDQLETGEGSTPAPVPQETKGSKKKEKAEKKAKETVPEHKDPEHGQPQHPPEESFKNLENGGFDETVELDLPRSV